MMFDNTYKETLIKSIREVLEKKQPSFSSINQWGSDVSEKLLQFSTSGKMIRGSLLLFTYEAYTGTISEEAIKAAVALELFHAALLIHDDIMDNDETRRGQQTIFAQYKILAKAKKLEHAHHFGVSMGTCVGDIAFFLGFQLLTQINNAQANQLCMQEMMTVGLGQMQDIYAGYSNDNSTQEEIEKVYVYKTARYTFSLPMMMGALMAEQDEITHLEKLGEALGLIFQYTDDTLSVFGNTTDSGKPEGSDIRENKKTLYCFYLFQKASDSEKEQLNSIFGNPAMTAHDLAFVRDLLKRYEVETMITERITNLQKQAKDHIIQLHIAEEYKKQLMEFVVQLATRNS